MTVLVTNFENRIEEAINFLLGQNTDKKTVIFRGQSNSDWKLNSSLSRYRRIPHESWNSELDEMLNAFKSQLTKLGHIPHDHKDRLFWLEYAQHYGVPTPFIDFSYSPFVALYFAFCGLGQGYEQYRNLKNKTVALYIIDINQFAHCWAAKLDDSYDEKYRKIFDEFQHPPVNIFDYGYPGNDLRFIPFPSKHNKRMQRQQGCFIFDTLKYPVFNMQNLEDLIDCLTEPSELRSNGEEVCSPIAQKIILNATCISKAFTLLDLMNINSTLLYDDIEGVVNDIKQSYTYNPKSFYLRDVEFSPIDESRIPYY